MLGGDCEWTASSIYRRAGFNSKTPVPAYDLLLALFDEAALEPLALRQLRSSSDIRAAHEEAGIELARLTLRREFADADAWHLAGAVLAPREFIDAHKFDAPSLADAVVVSVEFAAMRLARVKYGCRPLLRCINGGAKGPVRLRAR